MTNHRERGCVDEMMGAAIIAQGLGNSICQGSTPRQNKERPSGPPPKYADPALGQRLATLAQRWIDVF